MPSTSTYIPSKVYKQQLLFDAFQSISGVAAVWPMMRMGSMVAPVSGGFPYYLTEQGSPAYGRVSSGGPYAAVASAKYLYAADAAWNSPTTAFTIVTYVQFAAAAATVEVVASKWVANSNRCWYLSRDASGYATFSISSNGELATQISVGLTASTITTGWTFLAARFTASTEMKLWVNAVSNPKTTSIPATIYDGASNFQLNAFNANSSPMAGNIGITGLYNVAVPDATITSLYNATKEFYGL